MITRPLTDREVAELHRTLKEVTASLSGLHALDLVLAECGVHDVKDCTYCQQVESSRRLCNMVAQNGEAYV